MTSVSIATQNLSSGVAIVNKGGLGNWVCVCISIAGTSCHKRRGHKRRRRRRYASHLPSTYWLLNLRKTQATTAQQPGFLTKHEPNTLFNLFCIEQEGPRQGKSALYCMGVDCMGVIVVVIVDSLSTSSQMLIFSDRSEKVRIVSVSRDTGCVRVPRDASFPVSQK